MSEMANMLGKLLQVNQGVREHGPQENFDLQKL